MGHLLHRPPRLTAGMLDVLRTMGGDLSTREWARRFGVSPDDVVRAFAWIERDRVAA